MALTIFNTLTREKEEFIPLDPNEVRMYTCGPTVYNYPHIGNYRAYVFGDILKRHLKYLSANSPHLVALHLQTHYPVLNLSFF